MIYTVPIYTNKRYISYLSLTTICHNYVFYTKTSVNSFGFNNNLIQNGKNIVSSSLCFSFMHIYKYNNNMETTESKQDNILKMKKKYCLMFVSTRNRSRVLNGVWSLNSKHKTINKNAIMTNIFNYNN